MPPALLVKWFIDLGQNQGPRLNGARILMHLEIGTATPPSNWKEAAAQRELRATIEYSLLFAVRTLQLS